MTSQEALIMSILENQTLEISCGKWKVSVVIILIFRKYNQQTLSQDISMIRWISLKLTMRIVFPSEYMMRGIYPNL